MRDLLFAAMAATGFDMFRPAVFAYPAEGPRPSVLDAIDMLCLIQPRQEERISKRRARRLRGRAKGLRRYGLARGYACGGPVMRFPSPSELPLRRVRLTECDHYETISKEYC